MAELTVAEICRPQRSLAPETVVPERDHVQLMRECTTAWTEAQQPVRRFIRSLVRDHQHVEDLTQEVAVTIVDKFSEYDRSRSFTAWALGIARNKVMNYWSKQGRDRHRFDQLALDNLLVAHGDLHRSADDRRQILAGCLGKLSAAERSLLDRHYGESMSATTLAERLGLTTNAIYIRLHRIRRTLLACIERTLTRQEHTS